MNSFWAEHAWIDGRPVPGVTIHHDAGVITAVTHDAAPGATAIRLNGLTLPGFANAHSHAFHRALRGRTHGARGSFWSWRDAMYEAASLLDPDSYRDLARAVFGEMVQAGFTAVGEFHYLHHGPEGTPYADPNTMSASLMEAAHDAGIRITILDTCYLNGGIGPDGHFTALDPVQRRFADATAHAWTTRVDAMRATASARVGAAIHSVRALDEASMETVAEWANAAEAPIHAHVSEQPAENDQSLAAFGRSPMQVLADTGALGPRFTAVHATHVSAGEINLLAQARAGVCLCPTTERDLADGIGPSADLEAAGVRLCTGSDAHTVIDPFEEMRGVEMHARLLSGSRGVHSPADLVAMGSGAGYRSIGWPEGGEIAPGMLADLVVVGCESPRLAGVDPIGVPLSATASDVTTVIVGGEVVVSDGRHVSIDVAAELRKVLA